MSGKAYQSYPGAEPEKIPEPLNFDSSQMAIEIKKLFDSCPTVRIEFFPPDFWEEGDEPQCIVGLGFRDASCINKSQFLEIKRIITDKFSQYKLQEKNILIGGIEMIFILGDNDEIEALKNPNAGFR